MSVMRVATNLMAITTKAFEKYLQTTGVTSNVGFL